MSVACESRPGWHRELTDTPTPDAIPVRGLHEPLWWVWVKDEGR